MSGLTVHGLAEKARADATASPFRIRHEGGRFRVYRLIARRECLHAAFTSQFDAIDYVAGKLPKPIE